jgi:hypothetical protein
VESFDKTSVLSWNTLPPLPNYLSKKTYLQQNCFFESCDYGFFEINPFEWKIGRFLPSLVLKVAKLQQGYKSFCFSKRPQSNMFRLGFYLFFWKESRIFRILPPIFFNYPRAIIPSATEFSRQTR